MLLALLGNGILSYYNTQQLVRYQQQVDRTRQVIVSLQGVLVTLVDAETGQRGYIITGKTSFLGPYRKARKRLPSRIAAVQALISGDAGQQKQLDRLRGLIAAKLHDIQVTVRLRRQGHARAARRVIASGGGKKLMGSIRQVISNMQTGENRILRQQSDIAHSSNRKALGTIIVATLANVALLGFVFYLVQRSMRRREQISQERARLLAREQAARVSVEQLAAERAAILRQIADAVLVADPTGTITFVNDAARSFLGMTEVGGSIAELVERLHMSGPDGHPLLAEETTFARAALQGETVLAAETRIQRPDGREIIVQESAAPVLAPDGIQLGAVAVFRDVTAQRTLEREKDEFLSAAAHDLKTPLTIIKGVAQLLRQRAVRATTPNLADLADGLGRIDTTATRMVNLINEMLDSTRIQMGRPLNLVRRPMDLVELVDRVVAEVQPADFHHRIQIASDVREVIGTWDEGRLERVLGNILFNAIKYSPDGGDILVRITAEAGRQGPWAVLAVTDQGIGIPATEIPLIFERFRRASNVAGTIPGTGIGLASVSQIVEQHGGTIEVESQEGLGSTFTIRLPLTPLLSSLNPSHEGRGYGGEGEDSLFDLPSPAGERTLEDRCGDPQVDAPGRKGCWAGGEGATDG